jgi:large subunit ribosomal protein L13
MSHARFARPAWHLIDARDQIVGRLATQIVHLLRGKHKPTFSPNYDCGDVVVVVNAELVKFTGTKLEDKVYQWHTGYPGGLKQIKVIDQLKKKPEEVKFRPVDLFVIFFNLLQFCRSSVELF